jgi:hypothetical protein
MTKLLKTMPYENQSRLINANKSIYIAAPNFKVWSITEL